ncbi:MAG: dTMP kinase [Thaumarchaeota archaeon]|nr:dTMP kinase [Nitrososphaerota archaeon]
MGQASRGVFIAIEGIDAVGKRTQSSLLGGWLKSKGLATATLSFPDYSTDIGREIGRFFKGEKDYPPQAIHMLLAANRWEKKGEIETLLSRNDAVVVNRYTGSNLAYGTSNGLGLEWLKNLESGLPKPDLVCVLDAPHAAVSSRRGPNKDKYERNLALQEKTRNAYLNLAGQLGWKVINAAQGIDSTNRALVQAVTETLSTRGRTI